MTVQEKYFEDAREGDEAITPSYKVTKERILAYADLTGDHTPVHVDEAYANASHFGGLVAHGLMGLSIADAVSIASASPAAFLGLSDQRGRIAVGQAADLVLLDDALKVRETWIDGVSSL